MFVDRHDWKLDPRIFVQVNRFWGPLEIDLFVTRGLSAQLPRFYSWRPDPLSETVDAFSQDWSIVRGYAFPPFALVGHCLGQLINQDPSPGANCSRLAITAVESPASGVVCSTTDSASSFPRPAHSTRRSSPYGESPVSRLATLSQSYSEAGISETAQSLLIAAWRDRTSISYSN